MAVEDARQHEPARPVQPPEGSSRWSGRSAPGRAARVDDLPPQWPPRHQPVSDDELPGDPERQTGSAAPHHAAADSADAADAEPAAAPTAAAAATTEHPAAAPELKHDQRPELHQWGARFPGAPAGHRQLQHAHPHHPAAGDPDNDLHHQPINAQHSVPHTALPAQLLRHHGQHPKPSGSGARPPLSDPLPRLPRSVVQLVSSFQHVRLVRGHFKSTDEHAVSDRTYT